MVTRTPDYNFAGVVDEFFALRMLDGPHADALQAQARERAIELLSQPDVRYMPAFKILDLLATLVDSASAIASEPQMRLHEATALLRANMSDNSPVIRRFVLDAALERARYEPMMIAEEDPELSHRDLALHKRWDAMLHAHQELEPLPDSWAEAIGTIVERAIDAEEFRDFRQGPLLQLFTEMLETARELTRQRRPLEELEAALGQDSAVWKRYALKPGRYSEKHDDEGTLPREARIPGNPGSSQLH